MFSIKTVKISTRITEFILVTILTVCTTTSLYAQSGKLSDEQETLASLKQKISLLDSKSEEEFVLFQVRIESHTLINVLADLKFKKLITPVSNILSSTHSKFKDLFGEIPHFKTVVRLMEENDFYRYTGAPAWTNAMFYRNEIIIPLNDTIDLDNLYRSVRHEFSHAITHALTAGRVPGWFDEGLAQLVEGEPNPALKPALLQWLEGNQPVGFNMLQAGFTKLDNEMVPAAYAQSLFATTLLRDAYGFEPMSKYFEALRNGTDNEQSFYQAYKISSSDFEKVIGAKLNTWASINRN